MVIHKSNEGVDVVDKDCEVVKVICRIIIWKWNS